MLLPVKCGSLLFNSVILLKSILNVKITSTVLLKS